MEGCCRTQEEILAELEKTSAGAPFLALGQTVFWDEPMKALVALRSRDLGYDRRFIAGVHDTDYFAKRPQGNSKKGYKALPHNDTTTKGLWSAAGEFSALFGSETIVTRERLLASGAKLAKIQSERPGYLDEITEAWGWRGVVSLSQNSAITAEKVLNPLFPTLFDTFEWAVKESLSLIAGPHHKDSTAFADALRAVACETADDDQAQTLAGYYRALLPKMYRSVSCSDLEIETTATTELLRFNSSTAHQPRFDLLRLFVEPETRSQACQAYDEAIVHSEIYPLERFGVGALPFDLYIPGVGRGTLRLGSRGGVVMTPHPVGFSYKSAPRTVEELAAIIERRFGPNCVLVGKAVTLIGMLAREFVFVFHEGASSYVRHSRALHHKLSQVGTPLRLNPILRVKLEPWDALDHCCAWFRLPEPFRRPFGVDELSGCSLAARWRQVVSEQRALLTKLSDLRRPVDLIQFLDQAVGGQWKCLAAQFTELHKAVGELNAKVAEVKALKMEMAIEIKRAKAERSATERAKGEHWRANLFEKEATPEDWAARRDFEDRLAQIANRVSDLGREWRALQERQNEIVKSQEAERGRELRRNLAFEAELTRVKLLRDAIVTSEGLPKAGHRPAAWWFPLVCPDGTWFRETARNAHYWLEPLV